METRPTPVIRTLPRTRSSTRVAPLMALLVSAVMLQACDRNDPRTVGEKVDDAVARTEQQAAEVKSDAGEAARDARQATANASDNVANKTKDMAITTEVKGKLAGDSELSALAINVDNELSVQAR